MLSGSAARAQWHPERPQFEWTTNEPRPIVHTAHSKLAAQFMANFFVAEAARNGHAYASAAAENDVLIYGDAATWLPDASGSSAQVYLF